MHKSMILGLSLVSMLFLAATTGMSMQVSAIQETEKLQSFSGSKKHDDKFVCRDGPFRGFYVVDPRACHVDIPPDRELLCEECIKYWLHFLNNLPANNPQTLVLINELATAINTVNFGRDTGPPGCTEEEPVHRIPGVQCLPIVSLPSENPDVTNAAQVYEICKQLDIALKYLDKQRDNRGNDIRPIQALGIIENLVLAETNSNIDKVVRGLFDCLEESLFPQSQRPIRSQEAAIVEQQSIDQQQQKQIEEIQQEIQQNLGQQKQQQNQMTETVQQEESTPQQQQNIQQKGPSSISQEQMHQQQIVKLKQVLESVR